MSLNRWNILNFGSSGTGSTQTLLTAAINKETIIFSTLFSNYSGTDNAVINYEHTNGTNVLFKFNLTIPAGNSPVSIDSKIVLLANDQIKITSDIDEVSVIISGDVYNV